jgi:hypothetical protein
MRARSMIVIAAAVLLVFRGAQVVSAQSLADIAKKEEERRKTVKAPGKVYTNDDLRPVPPPSTPPAEPAPANAKAREAPADAAEAKGSKDTKDAKDAQKGDAAAPDGPKNQEYWSTRQAALQTQLDRDQTFLDALQTRVNSLTTDFVNRDDPAQRAAIERERTRNIAELDRLQKALVTDRKALADFQEEARRAGVPPGWLR